MGGLGTRHGGNQTGPLSHPTWGKQTGPDCVNLTHVVDVYCHESRMYAFMLNLINKSQCRIAAISFNRKNFSHTIYCQSIKNSLTPLC